ncbi:MAG: ATP-binding protein [Candidatus Neomarinimicrobiota bacterium]
MENNKTKLKINLDGFDDLEHARNSVISFCRHYCNNVEEIDVLEMAILEACHNALCYGSKRKSKSLCELKLYYDNKSIKAIVTNYGKAYEVLEKDSFSIDQDFLQYKNGGLGIPLIKSLMDSVEYSRKSNNKNELIIVKKINNKQ